MKQRFFDLAKRCAKNSDHPQYSLGAVIVKRNQIVSFGWNRYHTHTKSPHPFGFIHAEVDAMLGVDEDKLKGCSIYVYRETDSGKLGNSRPCISCWSMLKRMRIKRVFY